MRIWLTNLWDSYRTGLWFLPSLMIAAGIALAFFLPSLDERIVRSVPDWLKTSGETARQMLGSLSSAMLTTAGVVFSATVVALSITASQLGPRLLRNFMGQAVAQVTLGWCLASSIYCLLLMRKIDDYDGKLFVPHISVIVATLAGLVTLCIVVYFIHAIARSVQPTNVAASVARQLDAAVELVFPERIGEEGFRVEKPPADLPQNAGETVLSAGEGYLIAIDADALLAAAEEAEVVIELKRRPGEFVPGDSLLAEVHSTRPFDKKLPKSINACCLYGDRRTPRQDVECAVNELVEVAVRALSPGINDPFTAIVCTDRLAAAVRRLAQRRLPSAYRLDESGKLRVIAPPFTFDGVLDAAFNQIRQYGAGSAAISTRLLEVFDEIIDAIHRDEDAAAVRRQAQMVLAGARKSLLCEGDLADVEQRYDRLAAKIESRSTSPSLG